MLLAIAAVLLIGNTIRLSIFARRREVEVMKLVGATNWFVRWPFMLEGMICGLVGAVLAVGMLLGSLQLAAARTAAASQFTARRTSGHLDSVLLALILLVAGTSRSARSARASRCAASCASERDPRGSMRYLDGP